MYQYVMGNCTQTLTSSHINCIVVYILGKGIAIPDVKLRLLDVMFCVTATGHQGDIPGGSTPSQYSLQMVNGRKFNIHFKFLGVFCI